MLPALKWTKRKWLWACQNKLFWVNLALFGSTCTVVVNTGTSDFWIRMWSLALQLIGAYIVLSDLAGGAKDFGLPGIIKNNWQWLKWGLGIPTVVNASGSATLGTAISSAHGSVRFALDPSATIEVRVEQLERYVQRLHDVTDQAFMLIHTKERELTEKIHAAKAHLEQQIGATNDRMKIALVGNYSLLLFGAVWVAIGTILSALAPDIPKLLSGEWGFCPIPFDNVDALKFRHFAAAD